MAKKVLANSPLERQNILNNQYAVSEIEKAVVSDIDVGVKSRMYGIFDFRSFLNIGMLLTESEELKLKIYSVISQDL